MCSYLTSSFTILEPQNPWIDKFYLVQERCAMDFKAPKLRKGSSCSPPLQLKNGIFPSLSWATLAAKMMMFFPLIRSDAAGFHLLFRVLFLRFFRFCCLKCSNGAEVMKAIHNRNPTKAAKQELLHVCGDDVIVLTGSYLHRFTHSW